MDSLATIFRHLLPSRRSFRLRRRSYHPRRRTHSLVRLHHSPTSRRSSQTTRRLLRPRCRLPALRNAMSQHVHEPRSLWRMSGRGGHSRLHVGLASCGGQGSDDGVQGRAMCRYTWSVLTLVLGSQRNLTSLHHRTNVFLSRQPFSTSVKGMEGSKLKTSVTWKQDVCETNGSAEPPDPNVYSAPSLKQRRYSTDRSSSPGHLLPLLVDEDGLLVRRARNDVVEPANRRRSS